METHALWCPCSRRWGFMERRCWVLCREPCSQFVCLQLLNYQLSLPDNFFPSVSPGAYFSWRWGRSAVRTTPPVTLPAVLHLLSGKIQLTLESEILISELQLPLVPDTVLVELRRLFQSHTTNSIYKQYAMCKIQPEFMESYSISVKMDTAEIRLWFIIFLELNWLQEASCSWASCVYFIPRWHHGFQCMEQSVPSWSRNQPQIWAWANPVSAAAEKSLRDDPGPALPQRQAQDLSHLLKSSWSKPWEHSPPTARQQQEMLLEKGSFSCKETSPSFFLIPFVLIFPFRARKQLCLGLEWSAGSCDGAKCCLPAASREILSHVAAGNVSGILCWSTQTNCIQRHAVFVQLIRPALKPE